MNIYRSVRETCTASTKGVRYLAWFSNDSNYRSFTVILKSYWLCFVDAMWWPIQFKLKVIQILSLYIGLFIYFVAVLWWCIKIYRSKDSITFGVLFQPVITLSWQNLAHIKAFYNLYSPKWRNYFRSIKVGK
jgi:hypothetical protein